MKRKSIIIAIVAVVVIVAGVYLIAYIAAYKSLHMPRQQFLKTPKDYGMQYGDIEFTTSDGVLIKGWWIPGSSNAVIIASHGYSANRAGWTGKDKSGKDEYIDWLLSTAPLNKAGYNLLHFDHRASGESGGDLITLGKLEALDLIAAVNWILANKKGVDRVGLLGFSMGGNVVLRGGVELNRMVKEGKIKSAAVIAIGPFIFDTMIDKSIRYWTALPAFFIPVIKQVSGCVIGFNPREEINPPKYVDQISPVPVFFIQAEKDEIGDVSDVKKMYEAAGEPKDIIIIPDALRFVQYRYPADNPDRVIGFYNRYLGGK